MAAAAPDVLLQAELNQVIFDVNFQRARRLILEREADVNQEVDFAAVLEGGPQVEARKFTPLFMAIQNVEFDLQENLKREAREFIKFLLNHRADPNLESGIYKRYPIEQAVKVGDPETVALMLARGADPTLVQCFTDFRGRLEKGSLLKYAQHVTRVSEHFAPGNPRRQRFVEKRRQIVQIVQRALSAEPQQGSTERPLKRPRAEASLWLWRNTLRASKGNTSLAEQMLARAGFRKPSS